jgi:hypothetical protein
LQVPDQTDATGQERAQRGVGLLDDKQVVGRLVVQRHGQVRIDQRADVEHQAGSAGGDMGVHDAGRGDCLRGARDLQVDPQCGQRDVRQSAGVLVAHLDHGVDPLLGQELVPHIASAPPTPCRQHLPYRESDYLTGRR